MSPAFITTVLLRSEQTGGDVSVIENTVPGGWESPPLHRHDFAEAFYVIEGELTFQLDEELVSAGPGELAFAPGGVAHTLANRSDAPARYVLVCTPAGFERYFARMEAERAGEDPPDWAFQDIPPVQRVGPRIGERS